MIERRTADQLNLKRYLAYRVAAWAQLIASPEEIASKRSGIWKKLSERTGIHKGDLVHIRAGESSSQKLAMKLSKSLGPEPLEDFLLLAQRWGEACADWRPGDPIADPSAWLSLRESDRWAEMKQRMPMALMRAGRAKQLLEDDTTEPMIVMAMEEAWASSEKTPGCENMTTYEWLAQIDAALIRMKRGSGLRKAVESEPRIKLLPKPV